MSDLELFLNAPANATAEELAAYLDEACGDDQDLRRRVESLIAADRQSASFMGTEPFEVAGETRVDGEASGAVIGHYKLLQEIGRGGFGTVYMAEQLAPVKRLVAFKIINLGMDTRQVVARFEVERQALAMMDHPNIAKVLDAGATESGRPFFVMELVRGIPITKFCEEQKLSITERLTLFIDVCRAVQHAHQKGIIHRDLKPTNVLVTLHDDKAVPKVIDFGVAKATQTNLTDKTLYTRFEQFIGTPAYMSPEQTQMSGLDIDTRSDIYTLGVLLYELLTGTTPFDGKTLAQAGQDEIRRVIREENPPKPSTRLTEVQKRHVAPSPVHLPSVQIDQDLDWIVMKALEKDRTRRYETATSLAADVGRHLASEPVEAGAPSTAYRLRKYVGRHRTMVGALAAVGVILLLASVVSTWMAVSATRARRTADLARQETDRAHVATEHARQTAEDERMAAQVMLADEELFSGSASKGLGMLVNLLREKPDHHVAGERLMSALRLREFTPEPAVEIDALTAAFPDLSADGSKLLMGSLHPEKVFRVYDAKTGSPLGKSMPFTDSEPAYGLFRPNHPNQVVAMTWSWDPTRAHAQLWDWTTGERLGMEMKLGKKRVTACFSPDGERLLFGGDVGQGAQVYDANDGSPLGEPRGAGGGSGNVVVDSTFSPVLDANGDRWAAIASRSTGKGKSMVWNVSAAERGQSVEYPLPVNAYFRCIRFDPAGKRVIAGTDKGQVIVWDYLTGDLLSLWDDRGITSVEFSPDGRLILTASHGGKARVWDAEEGQLRSTIDEEDKLWGATFSPDGQLILTNCMAGHARLWESDSGRPLGPKLSVYGRMVWFSKNGEKVLTAKIDGPAMLWGIPSVRPHCQLFRHKDRGTRFWQEGREIQSIDFSPDGQNLVTTGQDYSVRLWNATDGKQRHRWGQNGPKKAVFSSDGTLVGSFCRSRVEVRDAQTGTRLHRIPTEYTTLGAFGRERTASGDYHLLAGIRSGYAQLWNAGTGEKVGSPLKHDGFLLSLDYSPDETLIATGSVDTTVRVWDAATSKLLHTLSHEDFVIAVKFDAFGKRLLTTSGSVVKLWDVHSGQQLGQPFRHSRKVAHASFSPDDTLVLTCSGDTARLWNVSTGKPVDRALQHQHEIRTAAFSPDGKRIATASSDRTARVWDVESGLPVAEPFRHDGSVGVLAFSHDGTRLATGGDDLTVRLWEVPPYPETDMPTWVLDWAEAVGGERILADGSAEELSREERQRIKADVMARQGDDYFHRVAGWFYQPVEERTIDAFSAMTRDQWVENRIRENTMESLEEALRVDPDNLPALFTIADLLADTDVRPDVNQRRVPHYKQRVTQIIRKDPEKVAEELAKDTLARIVETASHSAWPSEAQKNEALKTWKWFIEHQSPSPVLVESGSDWAYWDQQETAPPPTWINVKHDETSWKSGKAPLGFGDAQKTLLAKGGVTYYFRHRFAVDESLSPLKRPELTLRLRRDDGAIVYLNGREVIRSNMPGGEVGPQTFAASNVGLPTETQFFDYPLDVNLLQPGANLIAVEVHQDQPGSSDISFDLELSVGNAARERLADWTERHQSNWNLEQQARVHWMLGQHENVVESLSQLLATLPDSYDPAVIRQRKEWQRRKADALEAVGRWLDAAPLRAEAATTPPRAPDCPPNQVDLTPYYTEGFFKPVTPLPNSYPSSIERLAETFDPDGGPNFDLRGMIVLNSGIYASGQGSISGKDYNSHRGTNYPTRVSIALGQKAGAVHFLQACHSGKEAPGVEVAHYRIRFEDGTTNRVPVIYGQDAVSITINGLSAEVLEGVERFAWKQVFAVGWNGTAALTRQTWENLEPDKTITHIEFVSAEKMAAPILVGITLE